MLVFKLLLTPLLIGTVSLVGRRWGPTVSGWLVGLPLTSAPIAIFLALDQGTAFASRAAQGTLMGLISVASFCLAYSWLSFRYGWLGCFLASSCIFFASTFILLQVSISLVLAFALVIAVLAIVLNLLPSNHDQSIVTVPPQWETLLRMVVATAFVLVLTGVSSLLGPQLSGLPTSAAESPCASCMGMKAAFLSGRDGLGTLLPCDKRERQPHCLTIRAAAIPLTYPCNRLLILRGEPHRGLL